jgi:hypothetical protein
MVQIFIGGPISGAHRARSAGHAIKQYVQITGALAANSGGLGLLALEPSASRPPAATVGRFILPSRRLVPHANTRGSRDYLCGGEVWQALRRAAPWAQFAADQLAALRRNHALAQ